MNKKHAWYFAPLLLAGCAAPGQGGIHIGSSNPAPPRLAAPPVAAPAPLQAPAAAPAKPVPIARSASPEIQHAVEDAVVCRVPVQLETLRVRMQREGLLGAPSQEGEHALRSPMAVYGLPVKSVMFNGDDEGDSGKVVSVTVNGSVQSALRAVAAKGLHPKRARKSGSYTLKTRNGTFDIIAAKTGTIIGCSVGWD